MREIDEYEELLRAILRIVALSNMALKNILDELDKQNKNAETGEE